LHSVSRVSATDVCRCKCSSHAARLQCLLVQLRGQAHGIKGGDTERASRRDSAFWRPSTCVIPAAAAGDSARPDLVKDDASRGTSCGCCRVSLIHAATFAVACAFARRVSSSTGWRSAVCELRRIFPTLLPKKVHTRPRLLLWLLMIRRRLRRSILLRVGQRQLRQRVHSCARFRPRLM